jgi:hypothetical protein
MGATSGLFLRDGDNLIALTEQPYDAEVVLQELLAKHPDLLPGEAMNAEDPRRFLLVKREAQVAGMELDHLFIDQDAVPTFVETKRGTNTQVRREVVAQMLDYAANAAGEWSADKLSGWLEERCLQQQQVAEEVLAEFDHGFDNSPEFWAQVEQNLRDGKVRLIFLADDIPSSLQRIVEFLNERMTPTEVLAVEVRQYLSGGGQQLLQAGLVGQTEKARDIKGQSRQPAAINVLADHGTLTDGTVLWLRRRKLQKGRGAALSDDDPRLRFTLKLDGNQPRVLYQPSADVPVEELPASRARDRATQVIDPTFTRSESTAVNDSFSTEPGGKTLGELATELNLWT